jgi:hypothetical protein
MHRVCVGLLAALAFGLGISFGPVAAAQVRLLYAPGSPQVQFACGEIRAALKTRDQAAVAEGLDALAKDAPKRTRESYALSGHLLGHDSLEWLNPSASAATKEKTVHVVDGSQLTTASGFMMAGKEYSQYEGSTFQYVPVRRPHGRRQRGGNH